MSFKDIKTNNQGFTIVELLIVVVVIAILAAITIVSYNGITNRANASAAKSTAATIQKKIELYQADLSQYPFAFSSLSTATDSDEPWYIAASTPIDTPTADNGKTTVAVQPCNGTATAPTDQATTTGVQITYWDYDNNAVTTTPITMGETTSCAATW